MVGADSFRGKIVIVDGPQRLSFCADERRFAFSIPNALSVPRAFIDAGIDLPELLGSSKAKKLRSTIEPELPGELSEKQRQLLAKYKAPGGGGQWKLPRSEERRVGKEWVSKSRSRGVTYY